MKYLVTASSGVRLEALSEQLVGTYKHHPVDDHVRGLSTFTIMAGLGGCFGYALGGINWDVTTIGNILGGHVRAVFTLITILFIACVTYTITSFKEIPLYVMELRTETIDTSIIEKCKNESTNVHEYGSIEKPDDAESTSNFKMYSKLDESTHSLSENNQSCKQQNTAQDINTSMALYLKSIIYMPPSIKKLCITNLFCWMAHVSYSLYFTDFVGEAVFEGNPMAVEGNSLRELYEDGVRFGCWGMISIGSNSISAQFHKSWPFGERFELFPSFVGFSSYIKENVRECLFRFGREQNGERPLLDQKCVCRRSINICNGWTAGIMYSTLFTIPYLIVAYYHAKGTSSMPIMPDFVSERNRTPEILPTD
ncbi:hypothetical protein NQ315_002516 [Exocentrus adspersus]|uniref:Uncharacterized protein n=1 Tax=Exocentrus adspersus TaxID=1586481 RepID=A0AAV8VM10_9CUCU|nr:hypothetical protein NQ315_002516 [Exocentrus adspersus]